MALCRCEIEWLHAAQLGCKLMTLHGTPLQSIIAVLNKLSKVALPSEIIRFIHDSTSNYGKVGSNC